MTKKFFLKFAFLVFVGGYAPQHVVADNLAPELAHLSTQEEEALRLASEWSNHPIKPIRTGGGKVVFVHGASLPTIVGTPMQITDIELEPGENINELLVGDSARWLVEQGQAGNTAHIFIKPMDIGLSTSMAITTDRRVYHLRLVSRESGHTPYVGFLYGHQLHAIAAEATREKRWNSATLDEGQAVADLSALDFNYEVQGRASWRPERVYNDGRQTFIRLPESAAKKDVPILLALQNDQEQMINYRVRNNTFEVDGLFEELVLISGVGSDQERIDVRRVVK